MRPAVDDTACTSARDAMVTSRRAEHQLLVQVADLEAREVARAGGYRSTRRLLEDLWLVDPGRAKRLVTQAALLVAGTTLTGEPLPPALPATAAVHERGLVEDGHMRVIAKAIDHLARVPGLDSEKFADAEATLAKHACALAPAGLEKAARRLINTLDPDGAAPSEEPEPVDEVHLLRRRDGRLHGTILIHSRADAELVTEVFDRLSARAGPDDPRTLAQRRAEVLADLCAQATSPTGIATSDDERADDPADDGTDDPTQDEDEEEGDSGEVDLSAEPAGAASRAPGCPIVPVLGRAMLALTIDHQWLQARIGHGLLDSEHPIDPATARRLACDAGVVPMIMGSRSEPLDVGRLSYTVPEGIRRALHVRDGGCSFPGCTRRPKRCAAHHIQHWIDNGETELNNLTLLCRYHHHLVHHDHWSIQMINGRPVYTPPRWIDPQQRPRPGGRTPLVETA